MDKILETIKLRDPSKIKHGFNIIKNALNWEYIRKKLQL